MKNVKTAEAKDKANEGCVLQIGKDNNVVLWKEDMQMMACGLYGMTGLFFSTNERYFHPFPQEEDYNPYYVQPVTANDAEEEEEEDENDEETEAPAQATVGVMSSVSAKLLAKLRESAFEGRRRSMELQRTNEQKLWPLMWSKMSTASQSKVREDPEYEAAYMRLDSIKLWDFIRRTHLTHIYGEDDAMLLVNIHDQTSRYNALRQGERELVAEFKTRFDNQVKSNLGAGVPTVSDATRAIDFLSKLDPRRYTGMLTQMRNNACQNLPGAYPPTLAAAFRIASGWTKDGALGGSGIEQHSAFLADYAFATVTADDEKAQQPRKPSHKDKKAGRREQQCFVCGLSSHIARDCPERKGDTALITSHVSLEGDKDEMAYVTTLETILFARHHVLLDNQASVNIFSNADLLTNITESKHGIILNGVQRDAEGVRVSLVGKFNDVGEVYYSENTTANILSFAAMEDAGADIRYDQKNSRFTLKPRNSKNIYSFCRQDLPGSEGRFYVCDATTMISTIATTHRPKEEHVLVETVANNLTMYTKREVAGAERAREMLARMGYPSVTTAICTLRDGNDFSVTEHDFRVADAIWGKDVASIKGKTKRKKTRAADKTIGQPVVQQQQILSIDIMFVEGVPTLVAVSSPLELTFAMTLYSLDLNRPSRSAAIVKKGVDEIVATLASRNFQVRVIMTDGEKSVGRLKEHLNLLGIELDTTGAGGHVAKIERRIQSIKERVRTHICGKLPFTLTRAGISMLILYCVSRMNYEHPSARPWGLTPREAFSGRKANGERDFRAAFGDYVQCTVPCTDNSMLSRTDDGVVMLPTGNRTGSVKILSLATGALITRDNFTILPMPISVIATLNAMALKDGRKPSPHVNVFEELQYKQVTQAGGHPSFITPHDVAVERTGDPGIAPLVQREGLISATSWPQIEDTQSRPAPSDVLGTDVENDADISEQQGEDIGVQPATVSTEIMNTAIGTEADTEINYPRQSPQTSVPDHKTILDFIRNGEQTLVVSATMEVTDMLRARRESEVITDAGNISVKTAILTRGAEATRVITAELKQMLEKGVWEPVKGYTLSSVEKKRIIRSSMFIRSKYNPDGSFNKLKARLVAGGDQQDKSIYDDLSSPTVATSSVFTVMAIAAHEGRKTAVVDVGGAFLNARMSGNIPVHMRLDKTMTDFVIGLDKRYMTYTDTGGRVTVLLKRALYGCVESAGLWHANLCVTMSELGYIKNEIDGCVFNRVDHEGVQCTACVHVDDLLITSKNDKMIAELCEGLRAKYGEISLAHGPLINYLGMTVDMTESGQAKVTMKGYIEDVLGAAGLPGTACTPATEGLYVVRESAPKVTEHVRVWFHRIVAKLLYVAKRVRPECLTAVSFLSTRVTKCDEDDVEKLRRLVRYIRRTKDLGLVLRPGAAGISVRLFVDASFGVHADGKSHTGSCVVIGDVGAVHCRSVKQLIVSKSSTEAELIGLSDSANQGLFVRTFLLAQGYSTIGPVIIYQDNLSCMALLERGKSGSERTRHIAIRYFWVKERVVINEVVIEHKGTKDMYANVLTKPLQGAQFVNERECLTGWSTGEDIEYE